MVLQLSEWLQIGPKKYKFVRRLDDPKNRASRSKVRSNFKLRRSIAVNKTGVAIV